MRNFNRFRAQGCPLKGRPLLLICLMFIASVVYAEEAQKPVVAGYFYPKDKAVLEKMVNGFVDNAVPESVDGNIFAIIVPHAGYQYSGGVAGYSFKTIKNRPFDTAIIVAPSHHYGFEGLAVLDKDSFLTPLGKAPIDKELTKQILGFDKRIGYYMQPFLKEHSAEVEVPFLQQALPGCKIVVILTGGLSYANCTLLRDCLTSVLRERKGVLLIASSDMSHYHTQYEAERIDKATMSAIEEFNPEGLFLKLSAMPSDEAPCGSVGVIGIMMAARKLGADRIKVLKYATSGDTTGDRSAVVGYCSAAIYKSTNKENEMKELLNTLQKERLLKIARATIETYIRENRIPEFKEADTVLNKEMGAFVTLHENGQLRGCIGNMIGKGPLYLTIRDMAIAAATEDPRFAPVRKEELEKIDIEISVLSPMEKIDDPDKIIMGKHGVMVKSGFRSGVYLPQVATETGWSRDEFMNSLCAHKAHLAPDDWKKKNCDIYIFSAEVFAEPHRAEEN